MPVSRIFLGIEQSTIVQFIERTTRGRNRASVAVSGDHHLSAPPVHAGRERELHYWERGPDGNRLEFELCAKELKKNVQHSIDGDPWASNAPNDRFALFPIDQQAIFNIMRNLPCISSREMSG
jgi:hypothetical protein